VVVAVRAQVRHQGWIGSNVVNECPHKAEGCLLRHAFADQIKVGEDFKMKSISRSAFDEQQAVLQGRIMAAREGCASAIAPRPGCAASRSAPRPVL